MPTPPPFFNRIHCDAYQQVVPSATQICLLGAGALGNIVAIRGSDTIRVLKYVLKTNANDPKGQRRFDLMKHEGEILKILAPNDPSHSHEHSIVTMYQTVQTHDDTSQLTGYSMPLYRGTLLDFARSTAETETVANQLTTFCGNLMTALTYLKQHRVVHRDIKPQNVYITDKGRAVLGDFDCAIQLEPNETSRITDHSGAAETKAPEAFLDYASSHASDIYSAWATLLIAVIGGKRLYQSLYEQLEGPILDRHKQIMIMDEPCSVIDQFPQFSILLAQLTQLAMAKDPLQRGQPSDVLRQLSNYWEQEPNLFRLSTPNQEDMSDVPTQELVSSHS